MDDTAATTQTARSAATAATAAPPIPLDPDAVAVLELMERAGRPPYNLLTPPEAREASRRGRDKIQPDPPPLAEVRSLILPGPGGDLPARLYRPRPPAPGRAEPALVYFHGGGWVIGDLDSHDVLVRELAARSGVTAIAIDYRLAPEHRFPAAVEDAFAATSWVCDHARALGLDPDRIAVGGDSAGGNLATVAAIMARDAGRPQLAFQLLIYPSTDLSLAQASHTEHAEQMPLTGPVMRWFRQHYLGDEAAWHDWRASPLLAPSLAGLPPAWLMTAGYDVLADEGREYARRLRSSGVSVEERHFAAQFHGFITMGRMIREANVAVREAAAALSGAIGGEGEV